MNKKTVMYQCLLTQHRNDHLFRIVAWIEARGAERGNRVELKGEDGLWDVALVFAPAKTAEWVRENDAKAHKGTRGFSDV